MSEGPTRRERREARAERLEAWAESREAKAEDAYERSRAATDGIPMGQPVLADHHSARGHRAALERSRRAMDATVEHGRMAERHRGKAANVRRELDRSIYSDDPDAAERLEAKLADLEARRDQIKAYNAKARAHHKATGKLYACPEELPDDIDLMVLARVGQLKESGALPAYASSNLGSEIRRCKQRLAELPDN